VQRGIEKVKNVLLEQFENKEESQRVILDTIFKAFNMD